MNKNKTTTVKAESQLICPFMSGVYCSGSDCALWDCQFRECGILGIGDSLERLVDVIIDRTGK